MGWHINQNMDRSGKHILDYINIFSKDKTFFDKEFKKYNSNKTLSMDVLNNCINNNFIYSTIQNI